MGAEDSFLGRIQNTQEKTKNFHSSQKKVLLVFPKKANKTTENNVDGTFAFKKAHFHKQNREEKKRSETSQQQTPFKCPKGKQRQKVQSAQIIVTPLICPV